VQPGRGTERVLQLFARHEPADGDAREAVAGEPLGEPAVA